MTTDAQQPVAPEITPEQLELIRALRVQLQHEGFFTFLRENVSAIMGRALTDEEHALAVGGAGALMAWMIRFHNVKVTTSKPH